MQKERKSVFIYILRIISAYAVVVGHISHQFTLLISDKNLPFPIQNIAVTVFFIISGYLAGNSFFLHKEDWGVEDYLKNRFIRIYPMFLISLFVVIYCDTIVLKKFNLDYMFRNNFSIVIAIANLMLLQMFPRIGLGGGWTTKGTVIGCFGSALPWWTLSVEWWLYISFGLLAYKWKKKYLKAVYVLLFVFALIIPINSFIGRGVLSISSAWTLGMGINIVNQKESHWDIRKCFLIASIFGMIGYMRIKNVYTENIYELYDPIITICFCIVIAMGLKIEQRLGKSIKEKTEQRIAAFSGMTYPLYLIHYSIMYLVFVYTCYNFYSVGEGMIITFLLSNIIAYIIYLLDKKMKRFWKLVILFCAACQGLWR